MIIYDTKEKMESNVRARFPRPPNTLLNISDKPLLFINNLITVSNSATENGWFKTSLQLEIE